MSFDIGVRDADGNEVKVSLWQAALLWLGGFALQALFAAGLLYAALAIAKACGVVHEIPAYGVLFVLCVFVDAANHAAYTWVPRIFGVIGSIGWLCKQAFKAIFGRDDDDSV